MRIVSLNLASRVLYLKDKMKIRIKKVGDVSYAWSTIALLLEILVEWHFIISDKKINF